MKKFLGLALLLPSMAAAQIINIISMETGDTGEFQSVAGAGVAVSSTVVYSGSYSFNSNPVGAVTGSGKCGSISASGGNSVTGVNAATGAAVFQFQYLTKPASKDEQLFNFNDAAAVTKMALRLNSSGNVVVCNTSGVGIATGTTVLNSGTWYKFNVLVGSGTSSNYELKINGNVELSGTGNFFNSGTDSISIGKASNKNSQTVDFYYDDIAWSSGTYPADGRMLMLVPSANGSNQNYSIGAGSGQHWQVVDAVPSAGDASYLLSTTVAISSETERMTATSSIGISGAINCIRVGSHTKQDGASNGAQLIRVLSGTTTFTAAASYAVTTTYVFRATVMLKDPNSSTGPWTTTTLDAMECGVREASAVNFSRISTIYAIVDYAPVTSGQRSYFYIQ